MNTDIKALRELLAKATPGPWFDQSNEDYPGANHKIRPIDNISEWPAFGEIASAGPHNAALIVAAVNNAPALLDRIEALEALNERLREALAGLLACDEAASTNGVDGELYQSSIETARAALEGK